MEVVMYDKVRNDYYLAKYVFDKMVEIVGEDKAQELVEEFENERKEKSNKNREIAIKNGWTEVAPGIYTSEPPRPNPENVERLSKEFEEWKKNKRKEIGS